MKCKYCGGERFTAHQLVRMDVIVDGDGEWVQNLHEDDFAQNIYDSERPYGPFQCCGCGAEYDELAEGEEPHSGPVEGLKKEEPAEVAYTCPVCGNPFTYPLGGDDKQFLSLCYGELKLLWACPSCGSIGKAVYDANKGNAFVRHEVDCYRKKEE